MEDSHTKADVDVEMQKSIILPNTTWLKREGNYAGKLMGGVSKETLESSIQCQILQFAYVEEN